MKSAKKISKWFWEKPLNKRFLISYTLIFLFIAFFIFIEFILNDRSFIWSKDGYTQHLKSVLYNAQWMKGFMKDIVKNHKVNLDTYSFGLGYGGDIINSLNYYTFGDIIFLPTIYLTNRGVIYYYNFVIVLRFYLAGLSFYGLFNYIEKRDGRTYRLYQALAGSLIYTFSAFSLLAGLRHPQFMIPVVMFPCIIWGLEKLLEERKPYLFVISVYITSMANFILFYMAVILTVFYFIWRELEIKGKKQWKIILKDLWLTICSSFLGIMLAGAIVIPIIATYVIDPRMGTNFPNPFIYSFYFIKNFAACFMSVDLSIEWTSMGYGALGALAILCMFVNAKKNIRLVRAFIIMTVMILMPLFGYIMYGTTYAGNRWVWGYALLVCYIVARTLPDMFHLSFPKFIKLVLAALGYLGICLLFDYSLTENSSLQMIILFAILSVLGIYTCIGYYTAQKSSSDNEEKEDNPENAEIQLYVKKFKRILGYLAVIAAVAGIMANVYYRYSYRRVNIASEGIDWKAFDDIPDKSEYEDYEDIDWSVGRYWNTSAGMVYKNFGSSDFYRVSGTNLEYNNWLFYGISATQYYWSTSNPYINEFRKELAITDSDNRLFSYHALDDRIALMSLTGVKIYDKSYDFVPYGFTQIRSTVDTEPYSYYINRNGLPLAFGYTNIASRSTVAEADATTLEKTFLKTAVIEDNDMYSYSQKIGTIHEVKSINELDLSKAEEIDYEYGPLSDNMAMKDNRIVTTSTNQTLSLYVDEEAYASATDAVENTEEAVATSTDAAQTYVANKENDYTNPGQYKNYSNYLYITGLKYEGYPRYLIYKGSDEKYDLDSKYGKEEWKELPLKNRRNLIRDAVLFQPRDEIVITVIFKYKDGSQIKKKLPIYSKNASWGTKNTDYIVNAGDNLPDDLEKVSLVFSQIGSYTVDDIKLIHQPLDYIYDDVNNLTSNEMYNIDLHKNSINFATHRITGEYYADEDSFLYFNIPYSTGWTLYVDGEERDLIRANIGFMGTFIEPGEHTIVLKYHSPGIKLGIVLSVLGLIIFVGMLIIDYLILEDNKEENKKKN